MKALPIRKGNDEPLPAVQATSQASMKAPPKRKGDGGDPHRFPLSSRASMKVYTSRYRTNGPVVTRRGILICLIESPYKTVGKLRRSAAQGCRYLPSMKALPKRKGNSWRWSFRGRYGPRLNESPSQIEGKCGCIRRTRDSPSGLTESPSKKEGKYVLAQIADRGIPIPQ